MVLWGAGSLAAHAQADEARAKKILNRARSEAKSIVDDAEKRLIELQAERDAIAAYIGDINKAVSAAAKAATGAKAAPKRTRKPAGE